MPERILIRAPNPVGDCVMATASIHDVRRAFPQAHISVLVRRGRDRILDGSPDFDEMIVDESAGVWSLLRMAAALRRRRFDLALLFTNTFRAAMLAFLGRVPVRVGYRKGGQGVFLTLRVSPELEGGRWRPAPMTAIYARLCAAAGVAAGDGRPRLFVSAECEALAQRRRQELGIAAGERLIGLSPGASFGPSKVWPVEHFAPLADRLCERYGSRAIIFAGPGEEVVADALAALMRTRPINSSARPLGLDVLKPFIRDLKLFVGTDAGPRHYAAAFGVPAVVLMGPTDPRWSAVNLERQEVVRHDVPCGPCHLKVCPLDHRCMVSITTEEVFERVVLLERRLGGFG